MFAIGKDLTTKNFTLHDFWKCLIVLLICGSTTAQAQDPQIGLEELIKRTIAFDPELSRLRQNIEISRARVPLAAPRRDPQLRLGYSRSTDPAIQRPFTEIREETITREATNSGSTSERSSESGRENRRGTDSQTTPFGVSTSETFNETRATTETSNSSTSGSGRFTESITRTTNREITPTSRGENIREIVTETTRSNFSESETERESFSGSESRVESRSGGSTDRRSFSIDGNNDERTSTSGSSNTRIVEESFETRQFSEDQADGGDEFSVQLRLYPRNPWETRALTSRAESTVLIDQAIYDAAARTVSNNVRMAYLELQFHNADVRIEEKKVDQLTQEAAFQKKLVAANRYDADDYARTRIDIVDTKFIIANLQEQFSARIAALAAGAHIEDPASIDLSDLPASRKIALDEIDPDALIAAAQETQTELIILAQRAKALEQDLKWEKAAHYPWLSLISASYAQERRFGQTYQEDFSIVAGFDLPIGKWFGKDQSKPIQLAQASIRTESQMINDRLAHTVRQGLVLLKTKRKAVADFASHYKEVRDEISELKQTIGNQGPAAAIQQNKLDAQLVELDIRGLRITRDYAQSLLEFERLIGTDIDEL